MSGTTTPNYGFTLPAIGGNQDTWGNLLNANWTTADSAIHTLASGYLPIGGGNIGGNLGVGGNCAVTGNLGVAGIIGTAGSVSAASLNASGTITSGAGIVCGFGIEIQASQVTDFSLYRTAPNRVLQWAVAYNIAFSEADNSVVWNGPSLQLMKLDYLGNLSVHGTVHGTNVLLAGGLSVGDVLRDLLQRVADLEALRLA